MEKLGPVALITAQDSLDARKSRFCESHEHQEQTNDIWSEKFFEHYKSMIKDNLWAFCDPKLNLISNDF